MKKLSYLFLIIFIVYGVNYSNKLFATTNKIGTDRLLSLLGKNIRGDDIQEWLSNNNATPEIDKYDSFGCYFYSFKARGISLRFDTEDLLEGIFFYSEGADGFRQYQGRLPFGLSFMLTRKEIESILGKPDAGGSDWVLYKSKGIGIKYKTKRLDDLNARIYMMNIQKKH